MMYKRRFTAVRAVSVLSNCNVNLYVDSGESIKGRWSSGKKLTDENMLGTIQKAKAAEIERFTKGGERFESQSRLYLVKEPTEIPEFVEYQGFLFKVYDIDFRPSRQYFKLLIARQI